MKSILSALDLTAADVEITDRACYRSRFAVSEIAAASIGAVGAAVADLLSASGAAPSPLQVSVNQRRASLWFAQSIHPIGWSMPPVWDAIAGDYETRDGWLRLHTHVPRHRDTALRVLDAPPKRDDVAAAVRRWEGEALEAAIVDAGGAAAFMRSAEAWADHPQGAAVAAEPLIHWDTERLPSAFDWAPAPGRPLADLRVLDLTRILAGPVATRTLAGLGADVLRIDPPGWDEASVVPDITLGKNCIYLDLHEAGGRARFEDLLSRAHVLVHGLRPGALKALGYGDAARRRICANLIDVSLNAYGWTGPWRARRGFDSLVQMSSGVAHAGQIWAGRSAPTPLPVQALDHATGYLMAAAVIRAVKDACCAGVLRSARVSLARTAEHLKSLPAGDDGALEKTPRPEDLSNDIEETIWGSARRVKAPLDVSGAPQRWTRPAGPLGSGVASWRLDV